jgi:hypothetical protein
MIDEKQYGRLKYFFTCYFTIGHDYADLKRQVEEYRNNEPKQSIIRFLTELAALSEMQDLEPIREFLNKHCMIRRLSDEKIREVIKILIDGLS